MPEPGRKRNTQRSVTAKTAQWLALTQMKASSKLAPKKTNSFTVSYCYSTSDTD